MFTYQLHSLYGLLLFLKCHPGQPSHTIPRALLGGCSSKLSKPKFPDRGGECAGKWPPSSGLLFALLELRLGTSGADDPRLSLLSVHSLSSAVLKSSRTRVSVRHLNTSASFQNGLTPVGMASESAPVTETMSSMQKTMLSAMAASMTPNRGDIMTTWVKVIS